MDYRDYYEQDHSQDFYEPQQPKRRTSIGAIVFTAIIFLLIGVLCAYLLLPGLRQEAESMLPKPTPGQGGGFLPGFSTPKPAENTPKPEPVDMPELDGAEVEIAGDSANPIPDIVEACSPGVVGIINYGTYSDQNYEIEQSGGSGFVISSAGYIVTNAHVVEGASSLGVVFSDGTELKAELRGMDAVLDIAVLKVESNHLVPLALGNSTQARTGEFVIAIGDPTGQRLAGTTTFGIISAPARTINIDGHTNTYIQTDAAINPGNSGGPMIDMAGRVIGITCAKTLTAGYDEFGNAINAEGLGFAIPINNALPVIQQLIQYGYYQRPGIGISVIEPTAMELEEYGIPKGIIVYSVTEGGPADLAGLQVDDIIVECNGIALEKQDDFVAMVQATNVGETLRLKYWREGEYYECSLVIGDLNQIG